MIFLYIIALLALTIFSFGFVDANFPIPLLPVLFRFVNSQRPFATGIYVSIVSYTFVFYVWILAKVKKKSMKSADIWRLIFWTSVILFLSFPAFSYDIFNYIATAKVTYLYKENPYIVMPVDIPNEPMLAFLHASNKVALYGPTWIFLTVIPYAVGRGNLLVTLYSFKAFILLSYLLLLWLIWRMSKKNLFSLVFFAFNPIVIIESLISSHNDGVMMFLALLGFFLAKQKRFIWGVSFLLLSVFVKGATVVLLPIYIFIWMQFLKRREIHWDAVWRWSGYALLAVFFLSPLREELYAWYFIWPLTFITLLPREEFLHAVSYGLTFGLPMRFAPFIFAGEWGRWVSAVKKIVTGVPLALAVILYGSKKRI